MSLFKKTAPVRVVAAPKSVETITATLSDTLAELQTHAEEQTSFAALQRDIADRALAAAEAHSAESDKAAKVAGNIQALLGV